MRPLLHQFAYCYILMPPAYPPYPLKCKRNNWMSPLLFLCYMLRKKWVKKFIFCMQINIKVSYQLILTLFPSKFRTRWCYQYWWTWSNILKVLKITSLQYLHSISKKKLGMEFIFCMQINTKFTASWQTYLWWKWPAMSKVAKIGSW